MKRVFSIILAALSIFIVAGCMQEQPDGAQYLVDNSLAVLSHDMFFQPGGGTGSIVVDTDGTVTAASDKSWLTVSVNGNTVNLTASENLDIESRYAEVTISSGSASTVVIAQQYGYQTVSFNIADIVADSRSHTYSFPYSYDSEMVVTSSADWITATAVNVDGAQSIKVELAENTTGQTREGVVSWKLGVESGEFKVTQYPAFNVNSAWTLAYDRDEDVNSILVAAGPEGPYAIDLMKKAEFDSKYNSVYESFAIDVVAAADPAHLFTETGDVTWAFLEKGTYAAVMVGVDEEYNPTGEYNYFEIVVEREEIDTRTPYEKWLGKWEVTRGDMKDTWVITEKVKDASYTITGIEGISLAKNIPGAEFPVVATFNAEDGSMTLAVQEGLGNVTVEGKTASMGIYGQILYQGDIYYVSGSYDIFNGVLSGEDEATLNPGEVTIASLGQDFVLVSMSYVATLGQDGWSFNDDVPTPLPTTIKQIERSGGSGEGGGDSDVSYDDWIGDWSLTDGTLSISADEAGSSYSATYSGWEDVDFKTAFDASTGEMVFYTQYLFEYDIDEYYVIGVQTVNGSRYIRYGDPDKDYELARAKMTGSAVTITGLSYTSEDEGDVTIQAIGFRDYQTEDGNGYKKGWFSLTGYPDITLPASASKSGADVMRPAASASHGFSASKSEFWGKTAPVDLPSGWSVRATKATYVPMKKVSAR